MQRRLLPSTSYWRLFVRYPRRKHRCDFDTELTCSSCRNSFFITSHPISSGTDTLTKVNKFIYAHFGTVDYNRGATIWYSVSRVYWCHVSVSGTNYSVLWNVLACVTNRSKMLILYFIKFIKVFMSDFGKTGHQLIGIILWLHIEELNSVSQIIYNRINEIWTSKWPYLNTLKTIK